MCNHVSRKGLQSAFLGVLCSGTFSLSSRKGNEAYLHFVSTLAESMFCPGKDPKLNPIRHLVELVPCLDETNGCLPSDLRLGAQCLARSQCGTGHLTPQSIRDIVTMAQVDVWEDLHPTFLDCR